MKEKKVKNLMAIKSNNKNKTMPISYSFLEFSYKYPAKLKETNNSYKFS